MRQGFRKTAVALPSFCGGGVGAGCARPHTPTPSTRMLAYRGVFLQAGEVTGLVVAGVDQGRLDVGFVDRDHWRLAGRDVELAIVVGALGVGGLVLELRDRGGDRVRDERADILEDGHGLLAVDDILNRRLL